MTWPARFGVPGPWSTSELPSIRIGERYVRFRATTIERWIRSQEACEVQQPAGLSLTRAVQRKRNASSRDAVG
jgi:hypothetical protein